jgi:hypothetical protein
MRQLGGSHFAKCPSVNASFARDFFSRRLRRVRPGDKRGNPFRSRSVRFVGLGLSRLAFCVIRDRAATSHPSGRFLAICPQTMIMRFHADRVRLTHCGKLACPCLINSATRFTRDIVRECHSIIQEFGFSIANRGLNSPRARRIGAS